MNTVKPKNIAIIYHDADFDGKLSNEVCRYWLKNYYPDSDIHSYGWDYGRPVPRPDGALEGFDGMEFYDSIYIVDLSVDELMSRPELRDKIVWIDHHKSAIEKWDRAQIVGPDNQPPIHGYGGSIHSWERSKDPFHADAGVPDELKDQFPKGNRQSGWIGLDAFGNPIAWVADGTRVGGPGLFTGYRIDGVAACRLCWQWFASDNGPHGDPRIHGADVYLPTLEDFKKRAVTEPKLIQLAGEYDVWDHRAPDAKALQFGLRTLEMYEIEAVCRGQFQDVYHGGGIEDIIKSGYAIKAYCDKQNDEYSAAYSRTLDWEGMKFCALNIGQRGNSDLVRGGLKPEHQAIFAWRHTGDGVMVSLYHAPGHEHLDLSEIAKRYGGGGHRGACGFRMTLAELSKILP